MLFARRDFPRRHAEVIDVPIADDHLDRGCHCLIAIASLGVALPLDRNRSSSTSIVASAL
jgi:hypothetical protein